MVRKATPKDEVMEALCEAVAKSSQRQVAIQIGVSNTFLAKVMRAETPVTPKIAEFLGFKREVVFRKIA